MQFLQKKIRMYNRICIVLIISYVCCIFVIDVPLFSLFKAKTDAGNAFIPSRIFHAFRRCAGNRRRGPVQRYQFRQQCHFAAATHVP